MFFQLHLKFWCYKIKIQNWHFSYEAHAQKCFSIDPTTCPINKMHLKRYLHANTSLCILGPASLTWVKFFVTSESFWPASYSKQWGQIISRAKIFFSCTSFFMSWLQREWRFELNPSTSASTKKWKLCEFRIHNKKNMTSGFIGPHCET